MYRSRINLSTRSFDFGWLIEACSSLCQQTRAVLVKQMGRINSRRGAIQERTNNLRMIRQLLVPRVSVSRFLAEDRNEGFELAEGDGPL